MVWLLKYGIVRVVYRVIESRELLAGIQCMKVECVAAGVEGGKQTVKE